MQDEIKEGTRGLLGLFGDWREIVVAWGIAILGGLARYAKSLSEGSLEKVTYAKVIGKLFLAGFSGLLFYWLTADWQIAPHWKALCIALSGHMGAEGIEFLEGVAKDIIRKWAGSQESPKGE